MGDENTPPIHVLLPTCTETSTDVFFEILKSVVLHTRLHDNLHINSMILGMTGETFEVDNDDLSVDWKKLTSNSRQLRQSKLLGFWAARHYPLICKKLNGAAWQPPKAFNVQVSEPIEIAEEEIDNIVSMKMKLRIIELNVCRGTSKKLNYFVQAPMGVGRVNVTIISSKMRAFDIQSEHIAECWKALKLGRFVSNLEQQMVSTAAFKAPQPSMVTSHSTIDQHQVVRRNYDQTAEKRNSRSTRLPDALSSSFQVPVMSPCNVLLTDVNASTAKNNVASEPKTVPTAKRARCVTPNSSPIAHDESNIDVLRVAVHEMQKDIHNLTKCLGHNPAENENQFTDGSDRFHLAVFKQKDSEISKLTEALQRLEKEKELWKDEKTKLNGDVEAKANLIGALQKLLEANSKLHGKMEEEVADADKLKIVMTETNNKLQEELTAVKSRLALFDCDFRNEIQDLLKQLSAANQLNCELTDTNGKLREEMNVAKNHSADVESNSQDLVQKLSAADRTNIELTDTNAKLQQKLSALTDHVANTESNFHYQTQDFVHKLSAADKINTELTDANGKLQQELSALTDHVANTESNFHYQIQDFVHKLSAADKINTELTDANGKLQQELDGAKIELKKNEKLSENLHNLKARTNILIDEFRARVEGTEKMNAQLACKNEKLQEKLNILKQSAGGDKELLSLPSRPEAELNKVPVHNGFDQAELEEKIQCIAVLGDDSEEKLPEPIDRKSDEGHSIEPNGALQTFRDGKELPTETVKSGGCVTVEPKDGVQNGNKISFWEEEFVSGDPVVQQCRPILQRQKFGWVKFQPYKNTKFCPSFVYPSR